MKLIRLVIPIAAGLLLAGGTLSALANGRAAPSGPVGLTVQETALLPNAESEDIHADASGQVWVSESLSGTVRRLDPATGMYTLYTGLGQPSDAQLGPDGSLWFADDNQPQLARMDLTSRVVTTWTAPTMSANNGMAFDSFGRVWFIDDLANIDRFDPSNHQMCTIPLPGTFDGAGSFLVVGGGAVWLGDNTNSGLGRIAATLAVSPTYTFWSLEALGAVDPLGLALAPNGDVWWGNGFGNVGRLEPSTNRGTLFGPPGLSRAEQVVYQAGKVWFTDPQDRALGVIDTATAVGGTPQVLTPTVSTLSPICTDAGAGQTFTAGNSTGVASFSTLVYTGTLNAEGNLFFAPPAGRPIGLTHVGFDLWATDPLRDRLLHFDTAAAHVFLPLIEK